jgi:predicted membrane chloride channel (bestrophin family)
VELESWNEVGVVETLSSLGRVLNLQTAVVTALSVTSTFLCIRFGFTADFPLTIIGIAVVFPLVFSISGAYKRREAALDDYGSMKAHGRAIYFAARDWIAAPELEQQAKEVLSQVLGACRNLFMTPVDQMADKERAVYAGFSELSRFIQSLRGAGLASGEVSRCNQYLSKMINAFESVKHIYQYRTPRTLRAYSRLFIFALPVIYGPYFADIGTELPAGLQYVMPILFSVVLVSLENIQEHLEDPFDQIGEDDVMINVEKFVSSLDL